MPNRTYIDLKNDITRYESEWMNIANRYEAIATTLDSPEIDPIIREAIFYSMWNAKAWYTAYAIAATSETLSANFGRSITLYEGMNDKLDYWLSKTNQILSVLQSVSAESSSSAFWGYEMHFGEWEENLYEQLRLIDGIYGQTTDRNRRIFDSLVEIENLNTRIEDLHVRFKGIDLPYQLYFAKSTDGIDYTKLKAQLIGLNNSKTITLSDASFEARNKLTAVTIPSLPEGQYMLQIQNRSEVPIIQIYNASGGWCEVETNRNEDFSGWIISGTLGGADTGVRYPVIKANRMSGFRYRIYLGNSYPDMVPDTNVSWKMKENYINPVALILDVKVNQDQAIYDFFYGTYIDELKDVLSNGNHSYTRTIKDKYGNVKAVYRMILDFATKSTEGFPNIEYQRIS